MKCPKCNYISFDHLSKCGKCDFNLIALRNKYGFTPNNPLGLGILHYLHPVEEDDPVDSTFDDSVSADLPSDIDEPDEDVLILEESSETEADQPGPEAKDTFDFEEFILDEKAYKSPPPPPAHEDDTDLIEPYQNDLVVEDDLDEPITLTPEVEVIPEKEEPISFFPAEHEIELSDDVVPDVDLSEAIEPEPLLPEAQPEVEPELDKISDADPEEILLEVSSFPEEVVPEAEAENSEDTSESVELIIDESYIEDLPGMRDKIKERESDEVNLDGINDISLDDA